MWLDRAVPYARVRRAAVNAAHGREAAHHELFEERETRLDWFDAVFMRKDPPFDMAFFFATHLLSLIDPARTLVINDPRGLRDANEKLYALNFPDVIPPSLVTSNMPRLKRVPRRARRRDDRQAARRRRRRRRLPPAPAATATSTPSSRAATDYGRRPIMAQRYLPEIRQGDKRVIVLDGEPLGAVLRVPRDDETRGNIHVGGSTVKTPVSDARPRHLRPPRRRACAPTACRSSAST